MWCQGVTTLENEHTWLIFEDGDGGDGGRWLMGGNGGGVSHAYDMGGGGSWLMGGNGGRVVSCHVACLRHDVVVVSGRVVSCRVPTTQCGGRVGTCRVMSRAYNTMGPLRLAFEAREGGWVEVW